MNEKEKPYELLLESERKYRSIFKNALFPIAASDKSLQIIFANDAFLELLGYSEDDLSNLKVSDISVGKLEETGVDLIRKMESKEISDFLIEKKYRKKDGSIINALCSSNAVHDEEGNYLFNIVAIQDITDRVKNENAIIELNQNLEEKVALRTKNLENANKLLEEKNRIINQQKNELITQVKEIHHRVKNNLLVVNSLLSFQSSEIQDENVLAIFKEAQDRVISISLLHEDLYRSDDLKNISVEEHFKKLIKDLVKNYKVGTNISLEFDFAELKFGIKTLLPLGLIINELITNSLKYAFKGREEGTISVSIKYLSDNRYNLIFGDDGIGIDIFAVKVKSTSMGTELIRLFTEQLNGTIEKLDEPGTHFKIEFEKIDKR